jgi:hypothetical protein
MRSNARTPRNQGNINPSWTVRSGAILELVDEAGDAFLAAHTKLREDERLVWSSDEAT